MSPIRSQIFRQLRLETVLGPERLLAVSFSGHEELARLFEYRVTCIAEGGEAPFDELLGTIANLTLLLDLSGFTSARNFNGIISEVRHLGYDEHGSSKYELTLVPTFWLLTQTADCRIFQDLTVPEIIEQVLGNHGISNFRFELSGTYPIRDYCVQYRETSFAFIQRLMEHEGISYFWNHDDGTHGMIICDTKENFIPKEGFEKIIYRSKEASSQTEGTLHFWEAEKSITPASHTLNAFDFLSPTPSPNEKLLCRDTLEHSYPHGQLEVYDNSGGYTSQSEGERLALIRRQERQCRAETFLAKGNNRGLAVGHLFTPIDLPNKELANRQYLIVSTKIRCTIGDYGSGTGSGEEGYEVELTGIPIDAPIFRPERLTEVPFVKGPQTALVTGPAGEEIFVDDNARVKVQFHWDRLGEYDDGSSCWIRVAQPWAGTTYGGLAIPRIGQEVIIDFLEGDPDRPILNGRLYNADSMPIVSNAGREESPARKSRDKARKKKEEKKKQS